MECLLRHKKCRYKRVVSYLVFPSFPVFIFRLRTIVNMAFRPGNFSFSVDLITQAGYQIDFLAAVDKIQDLKKPHIVTRSAYRYEKYWLPLAAAHPNECLSAPFDIEWVWHCHMLSPRAYSRDCVEIVNTVVNHTLKSAKDYQKALQKSQNLWHQMYASEREPFQLDLTIPFDQRVLNDFKSKITYNIVEAASRQKVFYYQVSLPHYKDRKYLDSGMIRYKKFLYLKQKLPDEFIVPCYDIDLLWHTHQLNPWAYKKDMIKYIGNLFNHDDNVTDRSEGSKLYNADMQTREQWKKYFNEGLSMFGAMYRGSPPQGFLYQITQDELYTFSTKKTDIYVEELSLQLQSGRRLKKFKLNAFGSLGRKQGRRLAVFKKPAGNWDNQADIIWSKEDLNKIGAISFDARHFNNLVLSLEESQGLACCGSKDKIGEHTYNVLLELEKPSEKTGRIIKIRASFSSQINFKLSGRYTAPMMGSALFTLEQGKYETATIPEHIQTLWGPVALDRLPPGKDNHCQVASHR